MSGRKSNISAQKLGGKFGSSNSIPEINAAERKKAKKKIKMLVYLVCNVNCHHKCEVFMPNLCGVNQKLLAEALGSIKKGRSEGHAPIWKKIQHLLRPKGIKILAH